MVAQKEKQVESSVESVLSRKSKTITTNQKAERNLLHPEDRKTILLKNV